MEDTLQKQIEILNSGINREDYQLFFDEDNNQFLKGPEKSLMDAEDDVYLHYWKNTYIEMDEEERQDLLSNFIEKNRNNRHLKKELTLARKILRGQKTMV